MNSTSTFLITTILAFALLSSITTSAVFATGNLDDEEEEEVLEQLQSQIQEIQGTLGTLTLNLTEGSNNIEANCPTTAEIVEEVIENITTPQEPNITEPEQPAAECPIVQQPQPEPEPIQNQTVIQPVEAQPESPQQNQTCDIPLQQNVTEIVEEIIENVTIAPVEEPEQQPTCNPIQEFIPGIVLPNVTEPVEAEPVQNETVSELEPIICPINGELLGYTNTTSGQQLPISAGENQTEQVEQPPANVTDEQEIASIEFEAACGCFVVDKTPEDLESNGGGESVEQGLYNQ